MCQAWDAERDFFIWMEARAAEQGHRSGCIGIRGLCSCPGMDREGAPDEARAARAEDVESASVLRGM